MRESQAKTFRAVDGVILAVILGLAIGVAVYAEGVGRRDVLNLAATRNALWQPPPWVKRFELPAKRIRKAFVAFLAVASLGIGTLSLPQVLRRRRRGGFPGPGVAASVVVALFIPLLLGFEAIQLQLSYWVTSGWGLSDIRPATKPITLAAAVLGVWSYLVLARAWRPRDDWRDWLGRWIGWCWIGLVASVFIFLLLWGW